MANHPLTLTRGAYQAGVRKIVVARSRSIATNLMVATGMTSLLEIPA